MDDHEMMLPVRMPNRALSVETQCDEYNWDKPLTISISQPRDCDALKE